jgi:hypothetical protein
MIEEKKKSWFKRHPIWTGILIFLAIMILIGAVNNRPNDLSKPYSSQIGTSPCKNFVKTQLPLEIIFDSNFKPAFQWQDGAKVLTLKDYKEIVGSGFDTEVKTGTYTFYQGKNQGENINEYYIDTTLFDSSIGGTEISDDNPQFYLKYDKALGTDSSGKILGNKTFTLYPKKYSIVKSGNNYVMTLDSYEVGGCKNI